MTFSRPLTDESLCVLQQPGRLTDRGVAHRKRLGYLASASALKASNLVMLFHAKGLTADSVLKMLYFSPPPRFEERLWDDLLRKRNRHLPDELRVRLPAAEQVIVPWGVAHMPGIAEGIEAAGFRLDGTREYTVIRFRFPGSKSKNARKAGGAGGQ